MAEILETGVSIDNLREICETELESIKGWKVIYYKELLVKEDEELAKKYTDGKIDKLTLFRAMLELLIIDWNFTNEKKEKYPVNWETIQKLPSSFTKEMVKLITWKSLEDLQGGEILKKKQPQD